MRSLYVSVYLLASLTRFGHASNCDPNRPFNAVSYNGKPTNNTNFTSPLVAYWSQYACYIKSDGSEPNMKEQCKDVCIPGRGVNRTHDGPIATSESCIMSNTPWSELRTGKPLLCGTDRTYNGNLESNSYV
jgi:hypothetical protein